MKKLLQKGIVTVSIPIALTGVATAFSKVYTLIAGTGTFILTLKDAFQKTWNKVVRHIASWVEQDKS